MALSGVPFSGPIGAARIGYYDGHYLLNPTRRELKTSQLDLVVAGTERAVLMVESEADGLSEEVMLGAVMFGHEQMQAVIGAIKELVAEAGVQPWDWQAPPADEALIHAVRAAVGTALVEAYQIVDKLDRQQRVRDLRVQTIAQVTAQAPDRWTALVIEAAFATLESEIVRGRVLAGPIQKGRGESLAHLEHRADQQHRADFVRAGSRQD